MAQLETIVNLRIRTPRGETQHLLIGQHDSFIKLDNRILTVSQGLVPHCSQHRAFRFHGKVWHYCRQELMLSKDQYLALVGLLNRTNPMLGLADSWF